jgi:hypothetical protein
VKLTKAQRDQLRQMFGGRCAYCGCELSAKGWHADHVEPIYRGWFSGERSRFEEKDSIDNLFPACAPCNIWKSVMSMETFRASVAQQVDAARKYSASFRMAERFGLVAQVKTKVVFYFETLMQKEECA